MSKASEYAERVKAAKQQPEPFKLYRSTPTCGGYQNFAWVSIDGELVLTGTIMPDEVPSLITWLQETFL